MLCINMYMYNLYIVMMCNDGMHVWSTNDVKIL